MILHFSHVLVISYFCPGFGRSEERTILYTQNLQSSNKYIAGLTPFVLEASSEYIIPSLQ